MNRSLLICLSVAGAGLLSACVELPTEPTVAVMPSPYKPIEVFHGDDQICRGYAEQEAKVSSERGAGYYYESYLQYRYNLTYEQCMYSKGNQVPNFAPPASVPLPPQSLPPPNLPPPNAAPPPRQ